MARAKTLRLREEWRTEIAKRERPCEEEGSRFKLNLIRIDLVLGRLRIKSLHKTTLFHF